MKSSINIKIEKRANKHKLIRRDNCIFHLFCKISHHLTNKPEKYFFTPCSRAYSKMLFSEMGKILDEKRSRLIPSRSKKLLFMHHNLRRVYTLIKLLQLNFVSERVCPTPPSNCLGSAIFYIFSYLYNAFSKQFSICSCSILQEFNFTSLFLTSNSNQSHCQIESMLA